MKSSWTLFKGYRSNSAPDKIILAQPEDPEQFVNSYKPIACSSSRYAFHEETEIPIIEELRRWSYDYFKKFRIYETITRVPSIDKN
jgi:hypothetical protein